MAAVEVTEDVASMAVAEEEVEEEVEEGVATNSAAVVQ